MNDLQQEVIARNLRFLLDKVISLQQQVDNVKETSYEQDVPPVPYAGSSNSLHFQRFDVCQVLSVDKAQRKFTAKACKPYDGAELWEQDTDRLEQIEVTVPRHLSVPEVDEFCLVYFTGMFDDATKPRYAIFDCHEPFIGKVSVPSTPVAGQNVYQVNIYRGSFEDAAGAQEITLEAAGSIFAAHWGFAANYDNDEPVIVWKANHRWWMCKSVFSGEGRYGWRWCRFQLTNTLYLGSSTATVIDWLHDPEPESPITVHDPRSAFSLGRSGCKGEAIWSSKNNRWEIVACEQEASFGTGELLTDLCGGSASFENFVKVNVSDQRVNPNPLPATATNLFNHRGETGDNVLIMRRPDDSWKVINVSKKDREVMVGVVGAGCTVTPMLEVYGIETCGATPDEPLPVDVDCPVGGVEMELDEIKIECESGALNRYTRTNTLDPTTGTVTYGSWVFDAEIGDCEIDFPTACFDNPSALTWDPETCEFSYCTNEICFNADGTITIGETEC